MPPFSEAARNIFGGVSQAPSVQRDASQFSELINFFPAFGRRLGRRPATEHVAVVNGGNFVYEFGDYTFTFADAGVVQAFNRKTGAPVTVVNNVTWGYLDNGTNLKAITVGDTAYVLNTTKVVARSAVLASAAPYRAHVTVQAGDYETTYRIQLSGVGAYTATTPAATAAGAKGNIATDVIASNLEASIVAGGIYAVNRYGSTLAIRRIDGADFTITTSDGLGDKGLSCVKDTALTFADLPRYSDALTVVQIVGDEGTAVDNYYVQSTGSGWKECTAPGQAHILNDQTLPVQITWDPFTSSFVVDQVDWKVRAAGDDITNPAPSFVGHTLSDLFVLSGRLGFVSGSRVTLSEAGTLTNFWRTSASQILSSDPIDVDAAVSGATNFAHALPWRGAVYLFTDRAQFILSGGRDGITAESVNVSQASAYFCDVSVRPIAVGQRVFFVTQENGYPHILDYHMKRYVEEHEAVDVCTHVPTYINGNPLLLAGDEALGVLFVVTSTGIYCYSFRDTDEGRVQSAWCTWTFTGIILGLSLTDSALHLVLHYDDVDNLSALEVLHLNDESLIYLDRRLMSSDLSVTYDGVKTTWVLPYGVATDGTEGNLVACDPDTWEMIFLDRPTSTTATAPGNHTQFMYVGVSFMSLLEFSTLYERDRNGDADDRGRVQLRYLTLHLDRTLGLDATVSVKGRDDAVYTLANAEPTDGPFRFPVMGRNTDTGISFSLIHAGPVFLESYSWEATAHSRVPRR